MMERLRQMLSGIGRWIDDLMFPQDVLCLCCDHALGTDDENGIC